jgi:hypothetical protein
MTYRRPEEFSCHCLFSIDGINKQNRCFRVFLSKQKCRQVLVAALLHAEAIEARNYDIAKNHDSVHTRPNFIIILINIRDSRIL